MEKMLVNTLIWQRCNFEYHKEISAPADLGGNLSFGALYSQNQITNRHVKSFFTALAAR